MIYSTQYYTRIMMKLCILSTAYVTLFIFEIKFSIIPYCLLLINFLFFNVVVVVIILLNDWTLFHYQFLSVLLPYFFCSSLLNAMLCSVCIINFFVWVEHKKALIEINCSLHFLPYVVCCSFMFHVLCFFMIYF